MGRYSNRDLVRDLPTTQLFLNRYFSTGVYYPSVAGGNQKSLLLGNPADSGVVLLVVEPTVRSSGQTRIDKHKNASIDTTGNAPPTGITNKASTEITSIADVQLGGDGETGAFSNGLEFSPKTEGGGGGRGTPGSAGESGVTNLIYPGDNLVLSATAIGNNRTISIDMDFVEYPEENIP